MRRGIWLVVGLLACGGPPPRVEYVKYRPAMTSERWCRLDAGVLAFVPYPQVVPPLVSHECTALRRVRPGARAPAGSTFAELVVEPGGSIEIPVHLPEALHGAGCRIDSVLIPHGWRSSDLAIEIASAGGVVPIVSYEQLPAPAGRDESSPTLVTDGPEHRRTFRASTVPPGRAAPAPIADPELWPTGAVLRFDGARAIDGAASVTSEDGSEPAAAAALVLPAYRHRIDLAASDSFSIVLRARERAFGIGVRSDRESPDPQLSYRAPGAEPMPTHLVAQVGVVVSRCGRPLEDVLSDLR